ncbi:hypothetical protein [Streptomyces albidoflavus]|uniref:hypothetical protein n=1 Tax=Streptomyces albidoflavus TaxID=1886 RepID=UPI0040432B4C
MLLRPQLPSNTMTTHLPTGVAGSSPATHPTALPCSCQHPTPPIRRSLPTPSTQPVAVVLLGGVVLTALLAAVAVTAVSVAVAAVVTAVSVAVAAVVLRSLLTSQRHHR